MYKKKSLFPEHSLILILVDLIELMIVLWDTATVCCEPVFVLEGDEPVQDDRVAVHLPHRQRQ